MPNKKEEMDYRKVVANSLARGNGGLKDLYERLSQIPEGEIQARIDEVKQAMNLVSPDIVVTQRRVAEQERRIRANQIISKGKVNKKKIIREDNPAEEEIAEAHVSLNELSFIGTQLSNEAEVLEYFPKVRATMQAIKLAQDKAELEVTDARRTVVAQEKLLEEARKAAEKALEAGAKAKAIEAQIAELKSDIEEARAKGRKPKVMEGLQEEIAEKEEEMAELGTPEDWKKAIEEEGICETKLATAVVNQDKKKDKQKGLENPWNGILKGYSWKELGDLTSEDISKLVGTKVEKPEAKWAEEPAIKDDKDKDKDNDKGKVKDSGRGQNPNGSNNFPNPSRPQEPPKPAPEQDNPEPEPDEAEHDEEEPEQEGENPDLPVTKKHNIFVRMIPPLARWLDKTQEKENAFMEQFRKENKGNPSWFQKLKARFSKTAEEVKELSEAEKALKVAKGNVVQLESRVKAVELEIKNYEMHKRNAIKEIIEKNETDITREAKAKLPQQSLSAIRSVAAMYIAKGDYTEEEMMGLMQTKTTNKNEIYAEVDEKDPNKGAYNDLIKNAIKSQLDSLTVSQLQERIPYLDMLGVYTDKELEDIQTKVAEREQQEKDDLNAKLAQAKAELVPAREREEKAKQAYEESLVSPSRQAHRDFGSRINGGETISTPEVEHVEAEIVREGDYTRANSGSAPNIGDPFAKEPVADDGAR